MRVRNYALLLVLTMTPLTAPQAAAGLYKWTDENGQVHYSQLPPTGRAADDAPESATTASKSTERAKEQLGDKAAPEEASVNPAEINASHEGAKVKQPEVDGLPEEAKVEQPEAAPIPQDIKLTPEQLKIKGENCEIVKKNLEVYKTFNQIRQPGGEIITMSSEVRDAKIKETEEMIDTYCN